MQHLIEIDGSKGEGGGQIIRTSLAFSAITKTPFRLYNIRPNRKPKPHLQTQHLMAALAAREITKGKLEKAAKGSEEFVFYPNDIKSGMYEFNIGTAGSCILVAQTIIPILLHAQGSSSVRIIGGTNVSKSPCYDYFQRVFLKAISHFRANVTCSLVRSGYYPRGNGVIELIIHPSKLKGCTHWSTTKLKQSIIRIANLPRQIAEREERILLDNGITHIEIIEEKTFSPGNVVTIWEDFKGVNQLGKPGKLAEIVANEAVMDFSQEFGDVDRHLADQLLVYAALAQGDTFYTTSMLTSHLVTNREIISLFLNRKIELIDREVRVY